MPSLLQVQTWQQLVAIIAFCEPAMVDSVLKDETISPAGDGQISSLQVMVD
jgi:hypothetical protein